MNFFEYLAESSPLADKALDVAITAHSGQKRKSGEDYVTHPIAVAGILKKYKKSKKLDELLAAAYLHDTLEDTHLSPKVLRDAFGELVFDLVKELTSDKKRIRLKGKTQYLIDKMTRMSNWALVIKLADRLHNTSDLKTADRKFRRKYIKETNNILNALKERRNLSQTQFKIIKAIENNLNKTLRFL